MMGGRGVWTYKGGVCVWLAAKKYKHTIKYLFATVHDLHRTKHGLQQEI